MNTSLRIVLFLVAGLIIAGIIWDVMRSTRKSRANKLKFKKPLTKTQRLNLSPDTLEEDEVILVKPTRKVIEVERHDNIHHRNPMQSSTHEDHNYGHNHSHSHNIEVEMGPEGLLDPEMMISPELLDSEILAQTFEQDHESAHTHDLDFDDSLMEDIAESRVSTSSSSSSSSSSTTQYSTERSSVEFNPESNIIICLTVMAKKPAAFLGRKLLDVFQEVQLYFGDMKIYHRYENTDGTGKKIFSVVSAVEPGIFELSTMDRYVTPGLTLFFEAERRNQAITAFELMLRTGRLLAQRLDGELRDYDRRPLTTQAIEQYRNRVRSRVG